MKRLFTIALCLCSSIVLSGQSCFSSGITFNTQADIDLFGASYGNCSIIDGDVHIDGAGITNLNGLLSITQINGELEIENTSLVNFSGLDNLVSVKQNLYIEDNDNLQSLIGLDALQTVGDPINDYYEFRIWFQPTLPNLIGLGSLTHVYGNFEISDTALQYFSGLTSLTSVSGDLNIYSNDALQGLTGLFNLTNVGGSLQIGYNPSLQNLYGLNGVQYVGGSLEVSDNQSLANLNALANLNSARSLFIRDNPALGSLNGLQNLGSVESQCRIQRNDTLSDISAIGNTDLSMVSLFYLSDNPLLAICDYISVCIAVHSANFIDLADNAPSCSSQLLLGQQCSALGVCVFTATNGDWNVSSNWSGNMVPSQSCDVYILNDRVCNVAPGTNGSANTICVQEGSELNFDSTSEITVYGN